MPVLFSPSLYLQPNVGEIEVEGIQGIKKGLYVAGLAEIALPLSCV